MSQEQNIPDIMAQGINGLQRIEKIVSRNITFDYEDLDQADELRQAINVVRNDLFSYNQALRNSKAQQIQQQQVQQPDAKDAGASKKMKAVDVKKDSEPEIEG